MPMSCSFLFCVLRRIILMHTLRKEHVWLNSGSKGHRGKQQWLLYFNIFTTVEGALNLKSRLKLAASVRQYDNTSKSCVLEKCWVSFGLNGVPKIIYFSHQNPPSLSFLLGYTWVETTLNDVWRTRIVMFRHRDMSNKDQHQRYISPFQVQRLENCMLGNLQLNSIINNVIAVYGLSPLETQLEYNLSWLLTSSPVQLFLPLYTNTIILPDYSSKPFSTYLPQIWKNAQVFQKLMFAWGL